MLELVIPGRPSDEANIDDAWQLRADLGVEYRTVSIESVVVAIAGELPLDPNHLTLDNVRVRTRMVLEYAVSNERDGLVLGAGNRSEHLLGYITKYGDAAVDGVDLLDGAALAPIALARVTVTSTCRETAENSRTHEACVSARFGSVFTGTRT